jgi:prolyl-tRNA editing enzyme YbaK/EbsC (Cys-tRNA(Pro) deacylase)
MILVRSIGLMQALTPADVQAALDKFNLGLKLVTYEANTATSELAAAAIGCTVAQIAKSICFIVNDAPILVVTSGINTVDDKKIAGLLEVGRKKVKMAKAEECIAVFGFPPGGVPPVGHRSENLKTFLDSDLKQYEMIWAAGGTANVNFGLTPAQLEQITGGTWAEVKKDLTA